MDVLWQDFIDLITSPYIWAALIAYIGGQFTKIIILSVKKRKITFREFFQSGSMPSTHTAATVAVTTVVGFSEGFGSPIFAVAFMFTLIVAYDAMHVRRAVGEQGEVLRTLIDRDFRQESKISQLMEDGIKHKTKLIKPYFSRGHRPEEVLVGGIVGFVIGIVVSAIAFWL